MKILTTLILLVLSSFFFTSTYAQSINSLKFSDCSGAIVLEKLGNYQLQLSGSYGYDQEFINNEKVNSKISKEINSAWFIFEAPAEGRFIFNTEVSNGKIQFVSFTTTEEDYCSLINNAELEVKRSISMSRGNSIALDLAIEEDVKQYPIDLKKGEKLIMFFQSNLKSKETLKLNFNFELFSKSNVVNNDLKKIIDVRLDKNTHGLQIQVIDSLTKNPVNSFVTIIGSKDTPVILQGTDFKLDILKNTKIQLRVDAIGYFSVDKDVLLTTNLQEKIVIKMNPLGENKTISIQDIEFEKGEAEILPTSEARIKRLKDFLALNSGVKIQICGHVNGDGETSSKALKLSEKRADKVKKYLIDAGIDKNRMQTKGYGDLHPVYVQPKNSFEEQVNRRVEIKIVN